MENGMERVDIAIIGTGPAGVSAAITAKVRNKSVLLIGSRELSEKMSKAHQILNYPGLPEVTGPGCRVQKTAGRSWHRGDGEARERGLCDGRLFWNPGIRRDS